MDVAGLETQEELVGFLGSVLEASTEYSLIATDVDGVIVAWNEGARRLYGYDASEIVGQPKSLLHTEADLRRGLPKAMMKQALERGKWEGRVERVRKNGGSFIARVILTPRTDEEGNAAGFLLLSLDFTHEVMVSEELERSQAYTRAVLESAPDAMVIVNRKGEIQLANAATETLFGYAREELIGRHVEMLIPDRYRDRHPGHRSGFFAMPRSRPMGAGLELAGKRKDGVEFPVEISLSPFETEEGPLATAAIRDVTERKRAEGKFSGLLESAPDAMVIVNKAGETQLANAETERLFGYTREELIGRPVEKLIPLRYHGRHPGHLRDFFSQPRGRPMGAGLELSGRRKDGSEFPVEVSLSPLETEEGLLATAAIRDVTERKRFEQDLREANVQLEAANRAKDRFLASMSHELRTPLNAILGFTGTILMGMPGPLNDEQAKQLRTVQANGRHLLSLINDLLDLARIEAGKLELKPEPIDCLELLEDVARGLRPLADEKGIALSVTAADRRREVSNDRRAVRQILINLTNNAIKFTDDGGVCLELSETERDGKLVTRLTVTDSGLGIKPADQARLFAAFEQIERSTAHPYEGTGLGLYICKTLATLIGAGITFESEFGAGSSFTLELPS
jgi:PAS domain S-box-containing protein